MAQITPLRNTLMPPMEPTMQQPKMLTRTMEPSLLATMAIILPKNTDLQILLATNSIMPCTRLMNMTREVTTPPMDTMLMVPTMLTMELPMGTQMRLLLHMVHMGIMDMEDMDTTVSTGMDITDMDTMDLDTMDMDTMDTTHTAMLHMPNTIALIMLMLIMAKSTDLKVHTMLLMDIMLLVPTMIVQNPPTVRLQIVRL